MNPQTPVPIDTEVASLVAQDALIEKSKSQTK
jgi:hypothetical protein